MYDNICTLEYMKSAEIVGTTVCGASGCHLIQMCLLLMMLILRQNIVVWSLLRKLCLFSVLKQCLCESFSSF